MRRAPRWWVEGLAAAVAGTLVGAAFVGAHGGAADNLHACHEPNALVRLVSTFENPNPCQPTEKLEEWPVLGPEAPQGPAGGRGPAGPPGPAGPVGSDGRPGPAYTFAVVRAAAGARRPGTRSAAARCGAGRSAIGGGWSTGAGTTVRTSIRSAPDTWTVTTTGPGAAAAAAGVRGGPLAVYVVCARAVTP